MVVIADFALPPEEFVLREAIDTTSDIDITLAGMAASPNVLLTPYVNVHGDQRDLIRFERALVEDSTTVDAVTLGTTTEERCYQVQWSDSDALESFSTVLEMTDPSPVEITFGGQAWTFQLRCVDRRQLSEFYEVAREELGFKLLSVTDRASNLYEMPVEVTPAQREALLAALELGYYTIPRRCETKDVADELGVSPQAVSQRLRRGHENVLQSTFTV